MRLHELRSEIEMQQERGFNDRQRYCDVVGGGGGRCSTVPSVSHKFLKLQNYYFDLGWHLLLNYSLSVS
jgi:hypothetical protein